MADHEVGVAEADKDRLLAEQLAGDQRRHYCGDDDPRQGGQRIAADDQLERIKRARQRCVEGGRDRLGAPQPTKMRRSARRRCSNRPAAMQPRSRVA